MTAGYVPTSVPSYVKFQFLIAERVKSTSPTPVAKTACKQSSHPNEQSHARLISWNNCRAWYKSLSHWGKAGEVLPQSNFPVSRSLLLDFRPGEPEYTRWMRDRQDTELENAKRIGEAVVGAWVRRTMSLRHRQKTTP